LVDCSESGCQGGDAFRVLVDVDVRAYLDWACREPERELDEAAEPAASRKRVGGRPGGAGDRWHQQLAGAVEVVRLAGPRSAACSRGSAVLASCDGVLDHGRGGSRIETNGKTKDESRPQVTAASVAPEGTVTFLFTDVEASTTLVRQLRDAYGDLLATHHRLLREAFAGCGGHEVDTQGTHSLLRFGARATP
jgi:hypothetical protein